MEATPERPAWTEVVGVLVACAIAFVLVVRLDHAAAEQAAERARAATADRAVTATGDRAATADAPRAAARRPPSAIIVRGSVTLPVGGGWSPERAGTPPPTPAADAAAGD